MKLASLVALSVALVLVLAACGSGKTNVPATAFPSVTGIPTLEPVATTDPALGTEVVRIVDIGGGNRILADVAGKTLYISKDDILSSGVSKCSGDCAATWPPLMIAYFITPHTAGLNGQLGSFRRGDDQSGDRQLTYQGKPLYRYSGDHNPGDTNGQGKDGRWSVAVP